MAWSATVRACPACSALDPAIAAPGAETLSGGAWQVGADLRARSFHVDGTRVDERRLGLRAAYAPVRWLSFDVRWRVAHQQLDAPNLARLRRFSVGDPIVGARAVVFRDRWVMPRHVLSVDGAFFIPVGHSRADVRMPAAQSADIGAGGPQGRLGLAYRWVRGIASLDLRAAVRIARGEVVALGSSALMAQLHPAFALALGVSGQRALAGDDVRAVYGSMGFWLRLSDNALFGTRVAVPLYDAPGANRLGPLFQMEVVFRGA